MTTALGQVTLVRYVAMMSPFFLVISGAVLATAARDFGAAVSRRERSSGTARVARTLATSA